MMVRGVRAAVVAAFALALGAAANPALARPVDDRPGAVRLADVMLDVFYSRDVVTRTASQLSGNLPTQWPANWSPLLIEAALEETAADRPRLEQDLATELTAHFTTDEIQIGLYFLTSSAGNAYLQKLAGDENTTDAADQQRSAMALAQLQSTSTGRDFARKLAEFSDYSQEVRRVSNAYWVPGVFGRFGAKLEAARAAALAAEGEAGQLRSEVACTLLPADDMRAELGGQIGPAIQGLMSAYPDHPEWSGILAKAVAEQVDASTPDFCAAMGHWVARGLTEDEDREVLAFLQSPAGVALRGMLAASAPHRPVTSADDVTMRRVELFMASPTGRKLQANLDPAQGGAASAGVEYGGAIVAGALRRFGEHVAADAG
jgi:hypothetical protein